MPTRIVTIKPMMLYRWNEVEYSTVCQSLKMDVSKYLKLPHKLHLNPSLKDRLPWWNEKELLFATSSVGR